jgi:hypothetical protein
MRSTSVDTLNLGEGSIDVEIEYVYHPGEPMVMYYPDGSGYPGYPADVELLDVHVTSWHVDEVRQRSDHWLWLVLDAYALEIIERDWETIYRAQCLEEYR